MATSRNAPRGPTLLIIAGLAVVALALLVVPPMLAPPSTPTPAPSLAIVSPTPSRLPEPSLAVSPYRSVAWKLVAFPDPHFVPARSLLVGDRVVVLGTSNGTTAGWSSGDGGASWDAATMPDGLTEAANGVPSVTDLAAREDRLLALGQWVDMATGSGVQPFAWTSNDRGSSWHEAPVRTGEGSIQILGLVGSGDRFIGYGADFGSLDGIGWWMSSDGEDWVAMEVTGLPPAGSRLLRLTCGPRGLVAAGSDSDRPPGHPAAWFSADGEDWTPTQFGEEEVGTLTLATGSAEGYLVAGQTGPDERTLSQRGLPAVWISLDGRRWASAAFPDLMGAQIGAAALNAAGAILVIERLTSGEVPPTTMVRFLRVGTDEVSDAELPLTGLQALALPDRFVVIGSCADVTVADCVGTMVGIGRPMR